MNNSQLSLDLTQAIYRQKLSCSRVAEPSLRSERMTCSRDSANYAWALWDHDQIAYIESGYALYLNRANEPLCWALISVGAVGGTMMDPRVIFAHGLMCGASGIILYHNHPSGNIIPSLADKDMTRKLKEAGRMLDMPLLDHLIMTPEQGKYLSMADEGYL